MLKFQEEYNIAHQSFEFYFGYLCLGRRLVKKIAPNQVMDSFPLEECKFRRAHFCKLFPSDGVV